MAYLGILLLLLSSCAVETQQRIRPADTSWIQKGRTTRGEIIQKFGKPNLAIPQRNERASWEYVEYGLPLMADTYAARGYTSPFEPRPRGGGPAQLGGAAPQVHRPPLESIEVPSADEAPQPLWLLYDARGIVRDFGFVPQR